MRSFFSYLLALQPVLVGADETYDYIILGGGTCGLVLANRLTEDPNISVAVVEAGDSVKDNFNVTQIANYFVSLDTPIDWNYPTQPQVYTDNRILSYNSGKALGGTSTINGATYIRAQKAQIDAWEQLGNQGWNWDSLWPYYKKSEHFRTPTPALVSKGVKYDPSAHGLTGHVGVGWSNYTMGGETHEILNKTFQNLEIPYNRDQSSGNLHGFSVFPSTINSELEIRADAARSYLYSIQTRPNLHLLTGTLAEKIIWSNGPDSYTSEAIASAVQIRAMTGGSSRILKANKEVIVSAGSHKSPVILENSGVGNPKILAEKNVPVKVNLPAVGENLQDQPIVSLDASAKTGWTGYTPFVTYLTALDVFGDNTSSVASYVSSQIPIYASTIATESKNAIGAEVVEKQLRIQADLIFNRSVPCAEILTVPSATSVQSVLWVMLPFSRGSTHLSSMNASSTPLINPNFFMLDWDAIAQTAIANLARKSLHTAPLGNHVGADVLPNTTVVPTGADVDQWMPFFKSTCVLKMLLHPEYIVLIADFSIDTPNCHPVGTCAMMSRELGGVVSPELVVYGTKNVRVVDASVLPFQIDGHLTRYGRALYRLTTAILINN